MRGTKTPSDQVHDAARPAARQSFAPEHKPRRARVIVAGLVFFVVAGVGTWLWHRSLRHVADARSCDEGEQRGCYRAAELYRYGIGVARNPVLARSFYERAYAMPVWPDLTLTVGVDLAKMLEAGEGGPRDLPRALELFERACREREGRSDRDMSCERASALRARVSTTPR